MISTRLVAVPVLMALGLSLVAPTPVRAAAPEGDQERGERIFRANCVMCHGADATGMMGMHPALSGAAKRLGGEGVEVTVRKGRAPHASLGGKAE